MTDRALNREQSGAEGPAHNFGPILVGVVPDQPPVVLKRAAELATALGVPLVCAYVDVTRYLVKDDDGGFGSLPIDPDGADDDAEDVAAELAAEVRTALTGFGVDSSFRRLAGDPARALGKLAESIRASLIVVGTREHGFGGRLEHLVTGSIAVHLTHKQHRPVVVVPTNPDNPEGGW